MSNTVKLNNSYLNLNSDHQINMVWKILKFGGTVGDDCDFTQADLATTFSNMNLIVLGDFTGLTIKLGGNVTLHQDQAAVIDIVELSNGAIVKGDLHCNTINIPVGAAQLEYSDFTNISTITGVLTIKHCTTTSSFLATGSSLTIYDTDLVQIVDVDFLTIFNSTTTDIVNVNNDCLIYASTINGSIGNVGNDLTIYANSFVNGSIGNVGNDLTIYANSFVNGSIGNVGNDLYIGGSDIGIDATPPATTIGTIGNDFFLYNTNVYMNTIGAITGDLWVKNSYTKLNLVGGIQGVGGNVTLSQYTQEGSITNNISGTLLMLNAKIFGSICTGGTVGAVTLYDSHIAGALGGTMFSLTMAKSLIQNVGTIQDGLAMSKSHIVNAIVSLTAIAPNRSVMVNSYIGQVQVIDSDLSMIDSQIQNIAQINSLPVLTIDSNNSVVGFSQTLAPIPISFVDESDITIKMLLLASGVQTLQFGDALGGGTSGFQSCNIKILAQTNPALPGSLVLNDTATDTFVDNVVDLYFGSAVTLGLITGGAPPPNILNLYGNTTAGIVGASAWTNNILGY